MARVLDKKINIVWRDENYGPVHRSVAFRAVVEPLPSDTATLKLARLYRRCGFRLDAGRSSWIAEGCPADTPLRLVAELMSAGYTVEHRGCFASPAEASAAVSRGSKG